jgi:hypothetical protein
VTRVGLSENIQMPLTDEQVWGVPFVTKKEIYARCLEERRMPTLAELGSTDPTDTFPLITLLAVELPNVRKANYPKEWRA